MGWLRLLLVCWAILGAVSGVELAWVRRAEPPTVRVFQEATTDDLYFYHPQLGVKRVARHIFYYGASADGKGFLYTPRMSNDTIFEFRTDGTQWQILWDVPVDDLEYDGASPDGRWYLFATYLRPHDYYLARSDGSAWYTFASPTGGYLNLWEWSHDSTWLFFEEDDTTTTTVYRVEAATGAMQPLIEGTFQALSADDQWLFYSSNGHLSHMDLATLDHAALSTHAGSIDLIAIDKQNTWVLYRVISDQPEFLEVWYLNLATHEGKALFSISSTSAIGIRRSWATDDYFGYSLPADDGYYAIYRMRPDGSATELLIAEADKQYVAWLDESSILYTHDNRYYLWHDGITEVMPITPANVYASQYNAWQISAQNDFLMGYGGDSPPIEINLDTGQHHFLPRSLAGLIYRDHLTFVGRKWHPLGLGLGILATGLIFGLLQWKRVQLKE